MRQVDMDPELEMLLVFVSVGLYLALVVVIMTHPKVEAWVEVTWKQVRRTLHRPKHRLPRSHNGHHKRYEVGGVFTNLRRLFIPNYPDTRKVVYHKEIRRGRSRILVGTPRPPRHLR